MTAPSARRSCPVCHTSWQPDPRHPNRRYCNPRCKAIAWRRRAKGLPEGGERPEADAANGAITAVANGANAASAVANGISTAAPCPHCHRPISLVTLLVPPAAAHVNTPPPPAYPHVRRTP